MRPNLPVLVAFALGVALIFGAAMVQRNRRAADAPRDRGALTEACDDGDGDACYELGLKWGNGDGGPTDPETARKYVTRSCDLGIQKACDFLPMMK